MKALHMIAFVLLVIGGLNWGLTAINFNLVDTILGAGSTAGKIVYILVGLSAVYIAITHKGNCRTCAVA